LKFSRKAIFRVDVDVLILPTEFQTELHREKETLSSEDLT